MANKWYSYRILIVLMMLVFISVNMGCGSFTTLTKSTRKIIYDQKSSDRDMIKKIGIVRFGFNTSPSGTTLEAILQQALIDEMTKECPDTQLVRPGDSRNTDYLTTPPGYASGKIDSFALIQNGRQSGLNAIVTGETIDIREVIEEEGFLWFKSPHTYASIRALVQAYDTSTGAKLYEAFLHQKIEVDATALEAIRTGRSGSIADIQNELIEIAEEVSEKICEVVNQQPWKGFIIAANEKKVTIPSGRNIGLKLEDTLDVYDNSNIINGAGNHQYYLLGNKIGEVKITDITENQAKAVGVFGAKLPVGSLVMIKEQ